MRFARRALSQTFAALLALTLVSLALGAPASAKASVGVVSVVGATTSSLTLAWSPVAGADGYEVQWSDSYDRVSSGPSTVFPPGLEAGRVSGPAPAAEHTVTGLRAGTTYCFRVRALNADPARAKAVPATTWAPRTCKAPIPQQGAATGPTYRVMTYNVCSDSCRRWGKRKRAALALIRAQNADVIALQEDAKKSKLAKKLKRTHFTAIREDAKTLLFAKSRFAPVKMTVKVKKKSGKEVRKRVPRARQVNLGKGLDLDAGKANGKRTGVWAEVKDKQHPGRRLLVGNAHVSPGPDQPFYDKLRRKNTKRMLKALARANKSGAPVVIAGDFNSHTSRKHNSQARPMRKRGYADAFELAMSLTRPNHTSVNQLKPQPNISERFGAHVDKVWVVPGTSRVLSWRNAARVKPNGTYAKPIPSDHSPIVVDVQLN